MTDFNNRENLPLLSVVLCGEKGNDASIGAIKALYRMLPKGSEIIFSEVVAGNLPRARNADFRSVRE